LIVDLKAVLGWMEGRQVSETLKLVHSIQGEPPYVE